MNSVDSLQMILLTELPMEFILSVISLVKMECHHFFFFVLIFFSHCNSLGKYRENISVGKIRQQFTNENIPLVFSFVFLNFLVVDKALILRVYPWMVFCFEFCFREFLEGSNIDPSI
jgi:hypothetical protein